MIELCSIEDRVERIGRMVNIIREQANEALASIMPVMIIMTLVGIFFGFNVVTFVSILISTLLLIVGVTLFTFGADISMLIFNIA